MLKITGSSRNRRIAKVCHCSGKMHSEAFWKLLKKQFVLRKLKVYNYRLVLSEVQIDWLLFFMSINFKYQVNLIILNSQYNINSFNMNIIFTLMCSVLNALVIHLLVAFKANDISLKHNQERVFNVKHQPICFHQHK